MNDETQEIIEVEAVDAVPNSGVRKVAPEPISKPKKAKNDHSVAIDRLSRLLLVFARLYFPFIFLGFPMGLAFAILTQQSGGNLFFLILMIAGLSLFALGVILRIACIPIRAALRRYMEEDPSYKEN